MFSGVWYEIFFYLYFLYNLKHVHTYIHTYIYIYIYKLTVEYTICNQRCAFSRWKRSLKRCQSNLLPQPLSTNLETVVQLYVLWRRMRQTIMLRMRWEIRLLDIEGGGRNPWFHTIPEDENLGSNQIFQSSKVVYNLKNSQIGLLQLKRFWSLRRCHKTREFLWWPPNSEDVLLHGDNN